MIEILGNLGEFIGSIAVVISLIYVAFQLRQTQKVIRAQAAHSRTELEFQLIDKRLQNPGMLRRSEEEWHAMPFEDKRKMLHLTHMHFVMYQNDFYQRNLGMIDPGLTLDVQNIRGLDAPYFEEFWAEFKDNYTPDFVQLIEEERDRRRH